MSSPENQTSPRSTGSRLPVIASLIALGTVFWMPHFALTVALGTLLICGLSWKDGSRQLLIGSLIASGLALLIATARFSGLLP
ncbi:hypothetical protein [Nesterenkonia sp. HG001]|uniref:hypothetical protein n=1 Tax=Nesterenkonia sp. HG001 TaxID=2983207 RepID=UPI002AC4F0E2|nr:hypothetical protein [Nesterenkonia sp. HG001]MDZ5077145.1 hypothetical protein [Nesterenkonia sp. HG001]